MTATLLLKTGARFVRRLEHSTNMNYLLASIIGAVLVIGFVWYGGIRTETILATGECVERTAEVEGFSGTPKEKWELFSKQCI